MKETVGSQPARKLFVKKRERKLKEKKREKGGIPGSKEGRKGKRRKKGVIRIVS